MLQQLKIEAYRPKHTKWDVIYTPKQDKEHTQPFHSGVPRPRGSPKSLAISRLGRILHDNKPLSD